MAALSALPQEAEVGCGTCEDHGCIHGCKRIGSEPQDVAGLVEGDLDRVRRSRLTEDMRSIDLDYCREHNAFIDRVLSALLRTSPTREVEGFVEAAADDNRGALVEALAEPLAAWAEADAARCAAVEAYNARLTIVNARRALGDWSERTEPEYRAMDDAAYLTRVAIQDLSEARQTYAAAQPPQQAASAAATTNNLPQEGKAS